MGSGPRLPLTTYLTLATLLNAVIGLSMAQIFLCGNLMPDMGRWRRRAFRRHTGHEDGASMLYLHPYE